MGDLYKYKDSASQIWDDVVVDSKGYKFVDMWSAKLAAGAVYAGSVFCTAVPHNKSPRKEICPGYEVSNVETTGTGLSAVLSLAGPACNVFGKDVQELKLLVNYDDESRLHVKIEDAGNIAYQVPISVFPTPDTTGSVSEKNSALKFTYKESPFSFKVTRKSNGEVLFDTSIAALIFEDQYLRIQTSLPSNPNIYGLGEHTDSLRLNTTDYTRTLWSRDAYGVPAGTNLYGNHPVYFDHRGDKGTHGVFMLSSSGMDVKINKTAIDGQYLEFNMMSGIIDLYFMDGPSPAEVAKQYSLVAGKAAMMPYWAFGFHQCRYGYRDYLAIAEVVYNYSSSGIPLETMWTDIDYMYERYIMTTDPDRFPLERVREYVDYLHEHNQHYVVMVDPAMAYQTKREKDLPYDTFLRARDQGLLVQKNGSIYQGVVWPGVTAFPDWFHPATEAYWNNEFAEFFDKDTGIDIDALWIDMNEAANFNFFGDNPAESAEERGFPPNRPSLRSAPRPIPGFPQSFQPDPNSPYPPESLGYAPPWLSPAAAPNERRQDQEEGALMRKKRTTEELQAAHLHAARQESASGASIIGFPDRNLLQPPYQIKNHNTVQTYGGLSNFTLDTDIIHHDGHVELDVHNLYGAQMSTFSRNALLSRRPEVRPLIITRSTFAGSGKGVGKWLGDNLSTWELYRNSIQGMLNFVSLFQMPMTGSDICGFGGNTTEILCARWASLGAFNPFYRNHNGDSSIPQEFYNWPLVTESAKKAIDIRYRLLDYIYTALHQQATDGTPLLQPLFFHYPKDAKTFGLELQFFYGPSLLVSPVTEENATSVDIYLPKDSYYDFSTYAKVQGAGRTITLKDVDFTEIPLHIKSGGIIPIRKESGYTTTDVRKQPFNILVAPTSSGRAAGSLYLDDGESLVQVSTSEIDFTYERGTLSISGNFGYTAENASVYEVIILGVEKAPKAVDLSQGQEEKDGKKSWIKCDSDKWSYDGKTQAVKVTVEKTLDGEMSVRIQ